MRGRKGSGQGWYLHNRAGRLVLVYRDADGCWRQHRIPGEIRGERAAENYAKVFLRGLRDAVVEPEVQEPKVEQTLGELVKQWLEMRERLVLAGKIRPATLKQDRGCWKTHLEPVFGDLAVSSISADKVREFVIDLSTRRAAFTTRNVTSTLKTIFDDIEPWQPTPLRNPVRSKSVVGVLPKPRTVAGIKLRVVVPQVALVALLTSEKVEVEHKVRYVLAVTSGMRDGELHGLQVGDVKLEGQPVLSISKSMALVSMTKRPGMQEPKTEHGHRDLPLHPVAAAALGWWLKTGWARCVGRDPSKTDPVFPNFEGKPHRPRSSDELRADLALAGQEQTFKGQAITFHALRRCFSTYISRHPSASMVKAELMGHAGETVASMHYDGELDDVKRAVICSIDLPVTLADLIGKDNVDAREAAAE